MVVDDADVLGSVLYTWPVHLNTFQGRKHMFSHPSQDGGGFLPPHGEKEDLPPEHGRRTKRKPRGTTGEWVVEAMLRYKKTGCQITIGTSSIFRAL